MMDKIMTTDKISPRYKRNEVSDGGRMKINPAIFHRTKIVYFIVVHANLSVNEYNGF